MSTRRKWRRVAEKEMLAKEMVLRRGGPPSIDERPMQPMDWKEPGAARGLAQAQIEGRRQRRYLKALREDEMQNPRKEKPKITLPKLKCLEETE